jgi:hypothetical protein
LQFLTRQNFTRGRPFGAFAKRALNVGPKQTLIIKRSKLAQGIAEAAAGDFDRGETVLFRLLVGKDYRGPFAHGIGNGHALKRSTYLLDRPSMRPAGNQP